MADPHGSSGTESSAHDRHLFQRFPALRQRPWLRIADLPTPVEPLEKLGAELGLPNLWIKRDDQSAALYGGNKPRKLEFILGEAKRKSRTALLTLGGVGSHHATATAAFGRQHGFDVTLALFPQPVLTGVRQTILVNHALGAQFIIAKDEADCLAKIARHVVSTRLRRQPPPYVIYVGGSSPFGNTAFVEAGLELAAQVDAGQLPVPRYVFVPTGSCGTQAGLILGLRIAGLPTKVIGVRVVPKMACNPRIVAWQANRTARHLRKLDPSFPRLEVRPDEIELLDGFCGGQYGRPTRQGNKASALLADCEGLALDHTYSAKAFAGMLHFVEEQGLRDEPVLFWLTLSGADLSAYHRDATEPPEDLPDELKRYFVEPALDAPAP